MEQIVDFNLFGGGFQDFRPGHGYTASSSSSHVPAGAVDVPFYGFFPHFSPAEKSAKLGPHSLSELSADFISSTPSACEVHHFSEDGNFYHENDQKPWIRLPSGLWYLLCSEPEEYRDDPGVDTE